MVETHPAGATRMVLLLGVDASLARDPHGRSLLDKFREGEIGYGFCDEAHVAESFAGWIEAGPERGADGVARPTRARRDPVRAFLSRPLPQPDAPPQVLVGIVAAEGEEPEREHMLQGLPEGHLDEAWSEMAAMLADWGLSVEPDLYIVYPQGPPRG